LLTNLRIALMIGLIKLDLGAAEIRQPNSSAERQRFEVGMGRVDDFGPQIDGVFCRLAGARRINPSEGKSRRS
jgi:hypothetical protein